MQVIHTQDAERFRNSNHCVAMEYDFGDPVVNGAVIELTGRYPSIGLVMNTQCKELAYVVSGSGIVVIEGIGHSITAGDMILIQPLERYYWEGIMTLCVPCTPAWTEEQYQEVD